MQCVGQGGSGGPRPRVRIAVGRMDPATWDYINSGRHTVPGWFARVDALLFAAINDAQVRAGMTGDLMEIGAYMGRCAVLLGYFRGSGERLVVCDIFDGAGAEVSDENQAEHERCYGHLTRQAFERNFRRFHSRLPESIVAAPSATLGDRIDELGKRFRLVHVDGAHDYAAVQSDISLSRELLADGGMVVFDDVTSPHTPGVAAAVWAAVVNDGLIPHVVTTKLYASWGPVAPLDLSLLSGGWQCVPHVVAGHPVLYPQETRSGTQRLRRWIPPAWLPHVESVSQRVRIASRGRRHFRYDAVADEA